MSETPALPSYWVNIPYPVLQSQQLSDKIKLVYGVIAALTQAKDENDEIVGYCYASNAFLAELMGCGERTITRAITELVKAGELYVQHVGTNQQSCNHQRRIYTLETYARSLVKTGEAASFGEAGLAKFGEAVFNRFDKESKNIPPISPKGDDAELDLMFARFWKLYPRKTNKQAARRAWYKLKPDLLLCSRMSQALKAQMRSDAWRRDNGRYIPHPSTWLNGRRWEDEITPAQPAAARPGAGLTEEDMPL